MGYSEVEDEWLLQVEAERWWLLQFTSFLTFLPADHDTLDDYGTALTHGILPRIPF